MRFRWGRALRHHVAPFVPERIKTPLRPRLFGYRASAVAFPIELSSDDRGHVAVIDRRITLRYRGEDARDFQYHLADNGESIEEIASFMALAESSRTMFDVGAAKGLFSLIFCLQDEHRRAVAYEPSSSAVDSIVELGELNGCPSRITVRPVGVGLASGRAPARIDPSGIISVGGDASSGSAIDDLDIVSLDDEVRSLGVVPDLLKIDVEGYEREVLAGARRLLGERKPAICLELHLDLLERRGQSPAEVLAELESHGYRFRSCAGAALSASQICRSMHAIRRFVAV